jgi:hypothetical protein
VEGGSNHNNVSITTTGDITVESGGFIGGQMHGNVNNGQNVTLLSGGSITVNGTVQGNRGNATVGTTGAGNITVGGSVNANGGAASVHSTNGSTTVQSTGSVTATGNVTINSGPNQPTTINGAVESSKGNVVINGKAKKDGEVEGHPNPGNVLVNGTIKAAGEVYIKADTLFVNGEISAKTIQKVCKHVKFGPNGKIKGKANDAATKEHDKVAKKQDMGDRDGIFHGIQSQTAITIGDTSSVIDLRAAPLAISASAGVTLATGFGGTLDLRNNLPGTPVVTSPGPITLKADNVLLDPGVLVTDLMGPGPVMSFPSGPTKAVTTLATQGDFGYPEMPTEVNFLVTNMGNATDSYTLSATDSLGWDLNLSDTGLTLAAAGQFDSLVTVDLDVPSDAMAEVDTNVVYLEVTSTTDPSVSYVERARIPVESISRLKAFSVTRWNTENAASGDTAKVDFWTMNIGELGDTYALTVTDSLGWSPQFSTPDTVVLGVLGEDLPSVDVPIPVVAAAGQTNKIYVTVKSVSNPEDSIVDTASVVVQPWDFADHDVGNLTLSVTDNGALGFLYESHRAGSGLVYPADGTNLLWVGSLWVSQGDTYIANRDYEADPQKEWVVSFDPDGHAVPLPVGVSDQDVVARYTDDNALEPRSLFVRQHSLAWANAEDDDFAIIRYVIGNGGDVELDALRVGIFMDIDIGGSATNDEAATDTTRQLAYVHDPSSRHVGVAALEGDPFAEPLANLTVIHNPTYVWPQAYILDEDKLAFISAADSAHSVPGSSGPSDHGILVSVGPFDLAPGDSNEVAFAVAGGLDLPGLLSAVDRAEARYRSLVDAPGDPGTSAPAFRLMPGRPNPFRRTTSVGFQIPVPSRVVLDVFDVAGRRVRNLVSAGYEPGTYVTVWDGRNDAGHLVAGGVYYVKLRAGEYAGTRRVVVLR